MRQLLVPFLVFSCALPARAEGLPVARSGNLVRIAHGDASVIEGDLIRMRPGWLLVEAESGVVEIAADDVTAIEIATNDRTPRGSLGAALGWSLGLAGVGIGIAAVSLVDSDFPFETPPGVGAGLILVLVAPVVGIKVYDGTRSAPDPVWERAVLPDEITWRRAQLQRALERERAYERPVGLAWSTTF